MRTAPLAGCAAAALLLAGCSSAPAPRPVAPASAPPVSTAQSASIVMAPASGSLVSGKLTARPTPDGVRITGEIGGLQSQRHARHPYSRDRRLQRSRRDQRRRPFQSRPAATRQERRHRASRRRHGQHRRQRQWRRPGRRAGAGRHPGRRRGERHRRPRGRHPCQGRRLPEPARGQCRRTGGVRGDHGCAVRAVSGRWSGEVRGRSESRSDRVAAAASSCYCACAWAVVASAQCTNVTATPCAPSTAAICRCRAWKCVCNCSRRSRIAGSLPSASGA